MIGMGGEVWGGEELVVSQRECNVMGLFGGE